MESTSQTLPHSFRHASNTESLYETPRKRHPLQTRADCTRKVVLIKASARCRWGLLAKWIAVGASVLLLASAAYFSLHQGGAGANTTGIAAPATVGAGSLAMQGR